MTARHQRHADQAKTDEKPPPAIPVRDKTYNTLHYSLPQCSGLTEQLWAWQNPSSRKLSACLDGASLDPIGTIIAGRDSVSSFRKPHPVSAPLCFAWGQLRVRYLHCSAAPAGGCGGTDQAHQKNKPQAANRCCCRPDAHYYEQSCRQHRRLWWVGLTTLQVPDGNAWRYLAVTTNGALLHR